MNLVIDVGNTAIKMAVFKMDTLLEMQRTTNAHFLKSLSDFFAAYPDIQHSIISSVGKIEEDHLKAIQVFSPLHVLTAQSKVPFVNKYASTQTLGVDRIALVTAAHTLYPAQNVLVIDAGTCITYDLLTEQHEYLGGGISPGLRMRFQALNRYTAKLPLLEPIEDFEFMGNSTETSIYAGVLGGAVHEIDGFIEFYSKNFKHLTVILTGGDSAFLSKRLKNTIFAHSNFLLEGLNYILELNKH